MTTEQFKKLRHGNVITTVHGSKQHIVLHTVADENGDTKYIGIIDACTEHDVRNMKVCSTDRSVNQVNDEGYIVTKQLK